MDQQLLFLINHDGAQPWLDWVMACASSFDFWLPFLILAVVCLAIWGDFRMRVALIVFGLAIGVSDGIVSRTLKKTVGRPRPHETVVGIRTLDLAHEKPRILALSKPLRIKMSKPKAIPPTRGNSFPSSHTSNNFAVAGVGWAFFRRKGLWLLLPACLVGYSRVYVGSHWPSDVLASAVIGFGVGVAVSYLADWIWKKWGNRLLSGLHERHPRLLPK